MWLRVAIKNWRSIESAEVELSPFTIVVGRNSSGKSNFVDALKFMEEVSVDAATAVARRGGIESIRRWSRNKPHDVTLRVRSASSAQDLDTHYAEHEMVLAGAKTSEWRFKRERIELAHAGKPVVEIRRSRDEVEFLTGRRQVLPTAATTSAMLWTRQLVAGPRGRKPVPLPRVLAVRPAPDEMRKPQRATDSPVLEPDGRNVATALERMDPKERELVVTAMQKIVPGLIGIETQRAGRYLTVSFRQRGPADTATTFSASEMSEGALHALAVIVAAQQVTRHDLLIVEEPEGHLHPGAAAVLYDVLVRASRFAAVVVTTHSPELLDHAADADILVCEYTGGVTKIGPLATKQRALVREGLFTVAELMRSDELRRQGAQPRLVAD